MSRVISQTFPNRSAGVGGCDCSDADAARHARKCRSQRLPINRDVPAPTVAGGEVTQATIIEIEPDHDGDIFDPDTLFLTAEYVNEDGNLTDAQDIYVRQIKIGRKNFDCLSQDEELGVQVLAFSQPECCEGLEVCIPPFENKDNAKDSLKIEIVNAQTETLDDGNVVGRAVRLRGYLKGSCTSCGYEAACPTPATRG
ncbi:MAG: hypothetical protein ACE37F_14110 [Nannocystaceae bacterium]|nr:hypothetical protein [bacterium]